MTTPTAESMKKASEIIAGWDNWDDTGPLMSEIALALDNARVQGRMEVVNIVTTTLQELEANYDTEPINTAFRVARKEIVRRSKAIDSLAPAKTKGTE